MIYYEGKVGKKERRKIKAQRTAVIEPSTSLSRGECSTAALQPQPKFKGLDDLGELKLKRFSFITTISFL